jgi:hypothetical protein
MILRELASLDAAKPGGHSDGGGLYLFISRNSEALASAGLFAIDGKSKRARWGSALQAQYLSPRRISALERRDGVNTA